MSDQSLQQLLVTNFGLLPSGYTGSRGDTGYTGSAGTGYISDLRITRGVPRYTTTFTPPIGSAQTK